MAGATALSTFSASAQEVTLKLHQFLPPQANVPKQVLDVWADNVEKDSGGKIKVEVARELSHRLQHAPFEGQHHVVIFDPADALTEQAYNALLKSIEEPRPGVHFVMITTHPDGLLPTILSRCLPVRLGPLPLPLLTEVVQGVLAERQRKAVAEGEEAPRVARFTWTPPTER